MKISSLLIGLAVAIAGLTTASAQALRTGDTLSISVLQDPKLDRTVVVDQAGEIAFPLAGRIRARGLTPQAIENSLKAKLKDNFKDGRVDITVAIASIQKDSTDDELKPRVFITGEVAKPGPYIVRQRTTLMQAISLAGGLGPYAAKGRIQVRRQTPRGERIYPFDYRAYEAGAGVEANISLLPGDVILVPERGLLE
jgi:polysaccharide export outer membrane protein